MMNMVSSPFSMSSRPTPRFSGSVAEENPRLDFWVRSGVLQATWDQSREKPEAERICLKKLVISGLKKYVQEWVNYLNNTVLLRLDAAQELLETQGDISAVGMIVKPVFEDLGFKDPDPKYSSYPFGLTPQLIQHVMQNVLSNKDVMIAKAPPLPFTWAGSPKSIFNQSIES